MRQLSKDKRVAIVAALVEGNSVRSTSRLVHVSKDAVLKLLVDLGHACAAFMSEALVNLKCRRLQADEVWSYVAVKERNIPNHRIGEHGIGDAWTWLAICADCKLIPSWYVGDRGAGSAHEFMRDLAGRLAHRVQLTTDGHRVYLEAVEDAFGADIDYAQLIKIYGESAEGEKRYSPAVCTGTRTNVVAGSPKAEHVSTSFVERSNLSLRMGTRRFTRLTNAFSKKLENHQCAIALWLMYYNFGRIHSTLRVTPAMEAGVADHVWTLEEIVALLD